MHQLTQKPESGFMYHPPKNDFLDKTFELIKLIRDYVLGKIRKKQH